MTEYMIPMNAGQYLEVVFASPALSMAVAAFPPQTSPYVRPDVPSIIANIMQIA